MVVSRGFFESGGLVVVIVIVVEINGWGACWPIVRGSAVCDESMESSRSDGQTSGENRTE